MMKKNVIILFLFIVWLCFVFGDLSTIYAQDSDTGEFTLEEITVTAQKREENQQKVPIAMEVISGDELKELGKNSVEEILKSLGNAIISRAGDGLRVTLRGIADDADLFNDQHIGGATVGINIDGAYNNRSDAGQGLYDIERVEVLFGPQSTMYASSTPGGIVNIVTASPKTDRYEVSGSLEYGNYNYLHTEGAMNAPLSDSSALRASFTTSIRDGFISNGNDDDNAKSARLKFLIKPYDKLSVILAGVVSRSARRGFATVVAFDKESDRDNPWTSEDAADPPGNMTQKSITANIDWDLGIGTLALVPSYSKNNSYGTRTMTDMDGNTSTQEFTSSNNQKNIEARMTSDPDFLFTWILGGNYFLSEDRRSSYSTSSASNNVNDQKKRAVFATVTYPVKETFRVTGGYRISWDETHTINEATLGRANGPEFDTLSEYPGRSDYKIGVEFDLGPNSMLFADHSTSYRLQGAMMPRGDGKLYDPEKLKSYTVGAKNRFFSNKLQLNVSAYYYDYKNKFANQMIVAYGITEDMAQVDFDGNGTIDVGKYVDYLGRDGQPNPNASGEIHDPNAQGYGDLEKYGLDIQTNWIITSKDRLDLSIAYLHSQWATLYFDYYYDYVFPPDDYSGENDTFSPTITANLSYSHNFNLPNGGTLSPRIDARYQSEYFLSWNPVDDPYRYQEAHIMTDLSMAYAHSDGKWTLSGYVKNLGDYAEKKSYFSMGMGGGGSLMIGEPRTYGAVFSVRF